MCINANMWNLEKWCSWSCLQNRNRDTDTENKYGHQGEGRYGRNWKIGIEIYTLPQLESRDGQSDFTRML